MRPARTADKSAVQVVPNVKVRMEAQHYIPPLPSGVSMTGYGKGLPLLLLLLLSLLPRLLLSPPPPPPPTAPATTTTTTTDVETRSQDSDYDIGSTVRGSIAGNVKRHLQVLNTIISRHAL
jgi:hypothetical protein